MSNSISPNHREALTAVSSVTGRDEYLLSTNGALNTTGGGGGGGDVTITSPIGQSAMSASVAVAIASNQSALPVTGTFFQTTQPVSLASTTISGTVAVTQSTSPWVVSGTVTSTPSGTQDENLKQVNGATVNVGTGAAGTGTQRVTTSTDSTIASITNVVHIDDNGGSLTVDGIFFQSTQPISAASLPLPSGASTSANQTTANASLSSIDSKLSGTLTTDEIPQATLTAFVTTVTTAGTRIQLASNATDGGIIEADPSNTDGSFIYVGDSSVSSSAWGAKLLPGQSVGIAIDNTSKIWIDASANSLKCGFLGSS